MQPHDSIRRSPPFIKVLTHSAYFVAVFTCKYLITDRFLSQRTCCRKSPLHECTLLKLESCKNFQSRVSSNYFFFPVSHRLTCRPRKVLNTALKDILLKGSSLSYTQKPSFPFFLTCFDGAVLAPYFSSNTCAQREKNMHKGKFEGQRNYLITKNIICQKEQQHVIGLLCQSCRKPDVERCACLSM